MAAKGFSPSTTNGDLPTPMARGDYADRVCEEIEALWARVGFTIPTFRTRATSATVIAVSKTGNDSNTGRLTSTKAVTFTNGSPNVGCTSHGLSVGDNVLLSTTGALPTNFENSILYYVASVVNANTITLSKTSGGGAITAGSAGSGTHTAGIYSAVLTIQKGIDIAWDSYDIAGYGFIIQVGGGTYTDPVTKFGTAFGGTPLLRGDTTTPSNVLVSVTSPPNGAAFDFRREMAIDVAGFKVQTTTTGHGFHISNHARVIITGNMEFGAVAAGYHQVAVDHLSAFGSSASGYTISGGGASHISVANGSNVEIIQGSPTITLTGTPAFTTGFIVLNQSSTLEINATYSGSATGPRAHLSNNSVLDRFGTTLPGNSDIVIQSGAMDKNSLTGTWTPVMTFVTPGTSSITHSSQLGYWERDGGRCKTWFDISSSAFTVGTASGAFIVTGLPFTSLGTPAISWPGPVAIGGYTKANYTFINCGVSAGTTQLAFLAGGSAQSLANIVAADIAPISGVVRVRGSVEYPIA